ncbi:unnamed protein product [Trifolium pratense]|uniref:Uncharacterized protein n=1 Tax=Trifolium pratense TaxID=57577 RepID=A0ACB0JU06_TRIPR|nr:unnamed protein product [Trifolium pratense]
MSIFSLPGRNGGGEKVLYPGDKVLYSAHVHLLINCNEVEPYLQNSLHSRGRRRRRGGGGGGVGSSSQASARQNQNAGEQEYRPDLSSMVNLNQLPEYREGDPVLSMSIEDMSQMLNEPVHLQFFDPTGQTSGSSSGGSGRNNQQTAFTEYQRSLNPQQDFIIPHENPNQPQGNFFPNQAPINFVHRPVARPPSRTSLPGVIIHEEGRGRGRGRSRQPTDTGKGKRPLYQPPDQR